KQLNAGVTVFIAKRKRKHTLDWLDKFKKAVADITEIDDVYRMSGEIDYLLRALVHDITDYDAVYKKLFRRV
ncbi:Lrp/AsnC ligand binding domain-containing protein, partial [Salmonella enterica]|uniref:Lrp/AsnC ligand binding domain-containing protein n=1 Tax=Salmonella enterica TaxID=28901 RepID=UPI003297C2EE